MSSQLEVSPRRHGFLIGLAWLAGIVAGMMIPLGGLLVAVVATLTTFKHSSKTTRIILLAIGLLTLVIQIGVYFPIGHSSYSGPAHRVQ